MKTFTFYRQKIISLTPIIAFLFISNSVWAQFNIFESLKGNSVTNLTIGGSAKLTSGFEDPVNDGWLRLTSADHYQVGWAVVNQSFSSSLGVNIEFDYTAWRPDEISADGFAVFLFDASTPNFAIGADGGSLGYAQRNNIPGMKGGFVGVGIDEYGNYGISSEGKVGGYRSGPLLPNAISVRGPESSNYAYLFGTGELSQGVANNNITSTRPPSSTFYRRLRVEMMPKNNSYEIIVKWKTSPTGNFETIAGPYQLTNALPPYFKIGFSGSTGASINNHEVRNLNVTTPGNPRVEKTVDLTNAPVGQQLTYTVNVTNGNNAILDNCKIGDTIRLNDGTIIPTSDFIINSVTFNNNGEAGSTAAGFPNGVAVTGFTDNFFSTTIHLEPNATGTFTVVGTILEFPSGGLINNTASIDPSNSSIPDFDLTNNQQTVTTQVISPDVDLSITKSVDSPCISSSHGNTFTILVSNTGADKPGGANFKATVTDHLPSGSVVTHIDANGWTIANSGLNYTFTRTDALAAGFNYPPIKLTVTLSPYPTSVLNTATVSYQQSESNLSNNSSSINVYSKPLPPVIENGADTVKRKIGSTPVPINIAGNNVLWYDDPNGSAIPEPFLPPTDNLGSTTYYASQSNGTCESDKSSIVITITPNRNLSVDQLILKGKSEQQVNILSWETSSETNNKGFDIESSTDANNFKTIGFRKGAGNSNVKNQYTFTDNNPANVTYYRLKQMDQDGNYAFSNIVRLENHAAKAAIKLYPNPASAYIILEYNGLDLTPFKIFSDNGQLIKMDKTNGAKTRVNTQSFAPGTYFIMINNQTLKFTIQK